MPIVVRLILPIDLAGLAALIESPRPMRTPTLFLCAVALCAFVLLSEISAQSSLFNVPTTDILERGETLLEADLEVGFSSSSDRRWQSYGGMAIQGVSRRVEIGINAYAIRTANGWEPSEIQPNVKLKVYEGEQNGISIAAGAIGYIPVSRHFHRIANFSVYAVASKEFANAKAPRITAGGYQLFSRAGEHRESRGVLVGFEQPVFKRTTFVADWKSGKNRFGYAAAGFGFAVTKRSSLYTAYYFGNEGRGNHFLGVYYSRSF